MSIIHTKRRTFDPCGTKLAQVFQKYRRNPGMGDKYIREIRLGCNYHPGNDMPDDKNNKNP